MTLLQAVELAIRSMRAVATNHDDRMKLLEAENILKDLLKSKEEKKGK